MIKLIDFGVSQEYSPKDHILSERVGTLYSMAPETMLGEYTSQADLWSIGVIVFMLLADGRQPFDEATPKKLIAKVLLGKYNFDGEPWQEISDSAKNFIQKLLVVQPSDRMTAQTAREHPWIEENHRSHRHLLSDVDEDFKQKVRECIIRYTEQSQFVKLARNVIAKQSTPQEIFRLRSVFDEFDTDNTGTLSLQEFKAALSQSNLSDDDLEEMFRSIVSSEVIADVRLVSMLRLLTTF
jgi:serine/threonine protein kinase